ncbi:uncharacterized protein LOC136771402 [Amia ocellicauda]|uniref:uncharacterized protein LOC136771402 n=1 Tax=Amia ocellicauda TaxID=2972642 RepID=UPI0034645071
MARNGPLILMLLALPIAFSPPLKRKQGEVSAKIGDSVTLPCNGTSHTGVREKEPYIFWQTPEKKVCEFKNGSFAVATAFKGRVEILGEKVRQGDFSLTLHNVTFSDQCQYECYNRGQHIITSWLQITAHTAYFSLRSGTALSLPLFTAEPVEVLFAAAEKGASVSVCAVERGIVSRPGPGYKHRVSVQSGFLTLSSLTAADQGNYIVRDCSTGRNASTVSVYVADLASPGDSSISNSIAFSVLGFVAGAVGGVGTVCCMCNRWKKSTLARRRE